MKNQKCNKGFTLIEIVCAIAVLAVVVAPTLKSFMTSALLNQKSRVVMAETDIAQSIMEGITDKSFSEIVYILQNIETDRTASPLSHINGDAYNISESGVTVDSSETQSLLGSVSVNSITFNGTPIATKSLYSKEEDETTALGKTLISELRKKFGADFITTISTESEDGIDNQRIGKWIDDSNSILMLGYSNVVQGGNKYDVIVTFIPAAKTEDDLWFTYYVDIAVYKVGKANVKGKEHSFDKPNLVINSGIKNKKKY